MNYLHFYFLILILSLVSISNLIAQDEIVTDSVNTTKKTKNTSFGVIGVKFSNDWVYMGRSDSIKAPYITANAGYFHKSGMFLNTSFSYLVTESSNRIDLIAASVGYDYYRKSLRAGFSIVDYYYNDESYNVQSEMTFYANAYIGYDFKIVEAELDGALGLGNDTDVFVNVELSKSFYLIKNNLKLTPSLQINWGTQQYYNEYYRSRSSSFGNLRGNGAMGNMGNNQNMSLVIEESTKFQLLDFEFSVPMTYYMNKFRVSFKPTFAIPLNPAEVTVDDETYVENLKSIFFWSVGIMYRF